MQLAIATAAAYKGSYPVHRYVRVTQYGHLVKLVNRYYVRPFSEHDCQLTRLNEHYLAHMIHN